MGTHPIFESDFDCLTDGFAVSVVMDGGSNEKSFFQSFVAI